MTRRRARPHPSRRQGGPGHRADRRRRQGLEESIFRHGPNLSPETAGERPPPRSPGVDEAVALAPPTLALGVPTIWMGLIQLYERSLEEQPGRWTLPAGMRSLVGAFPANQRAFHHVSGRGYRFLADMILAVDRLNPQTAARLVAALGRWRRFDSARQDRMKAELERIVATPGLSKDVFEQASKSLA